MRLCGGRGPSVSQFGIIGVLGNLLRDWLLAESPPLKIQGGLSHIKLTFNQLLRTSAYQSALHRKFALDGLKEIVIRIDERDIYL